MKLDFGDEHLCEVLNGIISGLLPHENYEPSTFSTLYPALKSTIKTEDVRGIHYVFFVVFDKYFSLTTAFTGEEFSVSITKERFSAALENNLPDLILEPHLDLSHIMSIEGKSADISIPAIQDEAMGVVFENAMALYDECFEMAKSAEDAISDLIPLRDCIRMNMIESGMQAQRAIVATGLKVGRKTYRGTEGWLAYVTDLAREVNELDAEREEELICDNVDILDKVSEANLELGVPLGEYGIPQLDDMTPMLSHRFMVLVALENTGKTRVFIHLAANLIRNNKKVFFACGETSTSLIFNHIITSYIFQEYGMYFESSSLDGEGFEKLDEECKQIVSVAKARIATSGIVITKKLQYDDVQSTISFYANKGYHGFFIDHSQSLKGRKGRPVSDLVTNLALDCREMKTQYPIFVAMASHPSSEFKSMLQKGEITHLGISPTAQSATPSTEADEVFILMQSEYLLKQGLLEWFVYKRRAQKILDRIFIKPEFGVSSYVYDPKNQGATTIDNSALATVMREAGSSDADYETDADGVGLGIDF